MKPWGSSSRGNLKWLPRLLQTSIETYTFKPPDLGHFLAAANSHVPRFRFAGM
jgi:hypothetical protein